MIDFRPFRAWCPRPELAGRVASPPYDVLDDEEARMMIEKEPLCFLRVEKAEALLAPAESDRDQAAGRRARHDLERMMVGGVLQQLEQPSYFAYRMEGRGRIQTGLAGLAGCREWREGRVLRHEQTRADKVAGREANILATGSHAGPVLLASRRGSGLGDVLRNLTQAAPLLSVDDQAGVRHTLWPLGGEESLAGVSAWLAGQDRFLIADGHHRAEAACRVWEFLQGSRSGLAERASAFLTVVFPAEELRLLGYHRLVRLGTPAPSIDALPEKLSAVLQPAQIDVGPRPGEPVMLFGDRRYSLRLAPGDAEGADSTDASRLQRQVLGPLFGVEDPRTDPRLSFLGGEEAAGRMRDLCAADPGCVGFLLHPPALDLVFRVAAQGGLMPPKSTWFEPKLRSGILVNRFEE